jgi:PAS domain S-box-containing protein
MPTGWREAARVTGVALGVTAGAWALRSALTPVLGLSYPYQFFFLASIAAGWFGGFRAGALATFLGAAVVATSFTTPVGTLHIDEPADVTAMVLYLLIGGLMSYVTARFHRLLQSAEAAAEAAAGREKEYRSLFELSAVGSAELMPPDGRFVRVNQKLCGLTGYTEEQLLRLSFTSLIHPEDRAADMERYRSLLRGTVSSTASEVRLVRKDGEVIWIAESTTALRDLAGKLTRTIVVVQDVTERRRASDEQQFLLAASTILGSSLDPEETLTALSDLCVSWVCRWCTITLLEADGSLRRVTTGHADATLRPLAKELTEKYPPSREHSIDIFRVVDTGLPLLRSDVPEDVQERLDARPDLYRILRELGIGPYIVVPLISRGRTLGALSLMAGRGRRYDERDLRLAQELASRAGLAIDNALLFVESERANHAKDEFFAIVSHELKTPMTTILGWSQMLQMQSLDETMRKTAIESIHRSGLAQAKIIDDILDVARINTGKLSLESTPVDLAALVDAVAESMRPPAAARQIDLRLNSSVEGAAIVIGDPTRLQQIFMNMVMNAVKFTDPGGEIVIDLERRGGEVRVVVADTGIGITPDVLPYVFEAFRQGAVRNSGGLGLGLAIAKRLVEGHGGTIEAHSDGAGAGARFTVTLPLAA